MKTYRLNAIMAGILFIIGTVASIMSGVFTRTILESSDYLNEIASHEQQIMIGALFLFVAVTTCATIAIALYPVLKKYNESLALGAVCFRLMEGVLGIIGVISILAILSLSQMYVQTVSPDTDLYQTIGKLLLTTRDWVRDVPALLTWCIGALMYYWVFYQSKLVPRVLSVWGLVAIVLTIVSSLLVTFHIIGSFGLIQVLMNIPIFLQEMVLALWLIFKGFNQEMLNSK